jgi:hypothetical protein
MVKNPTHTTVPIKGQREVITFFSCHAVPDVWNFVILKNLIYEHTRDAAEFWLLTITHVTVHKIGRPVPESIE